MNLYHDHIFEIGLKLAQPTQLMINQHWFGYQAITWSNVDPTLCQQMASLGYNDLIAISLEKPT